MPKMEIEHKINQEQLDKVKDTVKRNWKPFAAGFVFAGITCVIMRGRIEPLALRGGSIGSLALSGDLNIRPLAFLSKQTNNIFVTIKQEIGRPPYLIHDITSDLWYGSQSKAAKALGVSNSHMSNHLNGLLSHVDGHILERVPING